MAGKKKARLRERDVGGMKHLQKLLPLLDRLHDVGCERDRAGNRQLHFDQYCLLVLLSLFNPVINSLQGISQTLTLVDSTLVAALPRIMHASCRKGQDQSGMVKWRLHTHFDVMRHVPDRIEVTPEGGVTTMNEPPSLE